MIKFELRSVVESTNWWRVTAGMAVDEIKYVLTFDGESVKRTDSLPALVGLYICAHCEVTSAELPGPKWYEITEGEERIIINRWNLDFQIHTTYEELECSLEPFLAGIFHELDSKSTPEERQEAFDFMNSLFDFNFNEMYTRVSSNSE